MALRPGRRGQFDVLVDGEVLVERGGNAITRRFGSGYPDPEEVVALLEGRVRRTPGGPA